MSFPGVDEDSSTSLKNYKLDSLTTIGGSPVVGTEREIFAGVMLL